MWNWEEWTPFWFLPSDQKFSTSPWVKHLTCKHIKKKPQMFCDFSHVCGMLHCDCSTQRWFSWERTWPIPLWATTESQALLQLSEVRTLIQAGALHFLLLFYPFSHIFLPIVLQFDLQRYAATVRVQQHRQEIIQDLSAMVRVIFKKYKFPLLNSGAQ